MTNEARTTLCFYSRGEWNLCAWTKLLVVWLPDCRKKEPRAPAAYWKSMTRPKVFAEPLVVKYIQLLFLPLSACAPAYLFHSIWPSQRSSEPDVLRKNSPKNSSACLAAIFGIFRTWRSESIKSVAVPCAAGTNSSLAQFRCCAGSVKASYFTCFVFSFWVSATLLRVQARTEVDSSPRQRSLRAGSKFGTFGTRKFPRPSGDQFARWGMQPAEHVGEARSLCMKIPGA